MTEKILIQAALRYLGIRVRSRKELADYLSEKSTDSEVVEKAMQYLENHQLIDDGAFARAWIDSRLRHGKGDVLISMELRQKGVSSEIITTKLQETDASAWKEAATKVLQKYQSKWRDLAGFQKKTKKYQIFQSRGFSSFHIDAFLKDRVE